MKTGRVDCHVALRKSWWNVSQCVWLADPTAKAKHTSLCKYIHITLAYIFNSQHTHTSKHRFLLQQAGVVMLAAVPPETMRSEGRETKREYWGKWTWPLRCLGEEGLGACWYLWIYNESRLCMCVCVSVCASIAEVWAINWRKVITQGGALIHLPLHLISNYILELHNMLKSFNLSEYCQ